MFLFLKKHKQNLENVEKLFKFEEFNRTEEVMNNVGKLNKEYEKKLGILQDIIYKWDHLKQRLQEFSKKFRSSELDKCSENLDLAKSFFEGEQFKKAKDLLSEVEKSLCQIEEKVTGEQFEIGCFKTGKKIFRKIIEYGQDYKLIIAEKKIDFEVDEAAILCESRYSNLVGLRHIDIVNKEIASKVLQLVFEKIGSKSGKVYRLSLDELLSAVSIFKPYSKGYLQFLLQGGKFECFSYDKQHGDYIYDPSKKIKKTRRKKSYINNVMDLDAIIRVLNSCIEKASNIHIKLKEIYE